ncbi:MAG: antitoxin [Calditrichaeota bacterium]|nr:MAG: antitoxin [Calditrichota bacterium]
MALKLTLRLNEELIKAAKEYSAKKGKSVSRLVADFFQVIQNEKIEEKQKLSPVVKSLKGILKGKEISEKDYQKYLEEKYL